MIWDIKRLRGHLAVWDLPHGGRPAKLYDSGNNVITIVGKERALELIAGESSFQVDVIAIGDNGVIQGPPRLIDIPVAADQTDTDLANQVAQKTASVAASFGGSVPKIIYTAEFFTADSPLTFFNPSEPIINEAGLRATDGLLFARRTFPSIPFDLPDRLGIKLVWTLGAL